MSSSAGQNSQGAPAQRARQITDAALTAAGWIIQERVRVNLLAGPGIAVPETPTATGLPDDLVFFDRRACGALEGKPEGVTLLGVVKQGVDYTCAAPGKYLAWANPLPFVYITNGAEPVSGEARDKAAASGARPRSVGAKALRGLIARVEVQPAAAGGRARLELVGELSALLAAAGVEGLGGNAKSPLTGISGLGSSALGDAGTRN